MNPEGRHICAVSQGLDIPFVRECDLNPIREVESTFSRATKTDFIYLSNKVDWEIVGLNNGWFEQVFNAKVHVLRIFSNICDSTVVGETCTNVLAEALVNGVVKVGQDYYEPTHPRYMPVFQKELDVIEIHVDDLSGHIVNLGAGITSLVLRFKRIKRC